MGTCRDCQAEIPNTAIIDGKTCFLHKRIRCLNCSPWSGVSGPNAQVENKRHLLKSHLKYYYGLSLEDFDIMNEACEGFCMICGSEPNGRISRLCVDHDHDDGRVRGLLCHGCNMRLGWFEKNRDQILEYLGIEYGQTTF